MKVQLKRTFRVDRLIVDSSILGTTRTFDRGEYRFHIELPESKGDFLHDSSVRREGHVKWTPLTRPPTMKNKRGSKRPTYRVGEVIVRVDLELPQSITAEKEEKLLSSANNAALEVMRDYIDQVRTHEGQFWLGHSADEPCSGVVDALEVDTGKRVVGPRYTIVLPPTTKKPLSTVAHEKALAAVATGNKPELADRLLADARHLLVLGDKYREAVLMAAIAAEVKIKEYLLKVCPEEGRSILEFALKNPRDVSLQAASLYDKGAEAVVGKSLRKDDKEAYKAVENLFAVRNKVAHEARETDGKEASKCVNAAERAIAWADSLLLSDEETGK